MRSKNDFTVPWTNEDLKKLKELIKQNQPVGVISIELGKVEEAVCRKAAEIGVILKPTVSPTA